MEKGTKNKVGKTKEHDNKVNISSSLIRDIKYIPDSLEITREQPSSPPPDISKDGDRWTVDMRCGRKLSSPPAQSFVNICGGANHLFGPWSSKAANKKGPNELNFFFGIVLLISVGSRTYPIYVYVGQGRKSRRNTWWIGGRAIGQRDQQAQLAVFNQANLELVQLFTIKKNSGVNSFVLDPWFF